MSFPRMCRLKQDFPRPVIEDLGQEVHSQLARVFDSGLAGKSVAITVGSRGISSPPRWTERPKPSSRA